MLEILRENPLLLLFLVAGIGYLVGQLRIGSFSLGVAAVLFVGLGFGALSPELKLPEFVYPIALGLLPIPLPVLAGLQTQPAVLAFVLEKTGSEQPNLGYATVYPLAMLLKILLVQLLLLG
jgi:uncharacterized transporter YbjL